MQYSTKSSTDDPLGVDRDPILLTTGLQSRVRISRSFYHQYPHPYSDCGVLEEDKKLVVELRKPIAASSTWSSTVRANVLTLARRASPPAPRCAQSRYVDATRVALTLK